jgi:hypothetical protein
MEAENSLLCSRKPGTGPYSEPHDYSPHRQTTFPQDTKDSSSFIGFYSPVLDFRFLFIFF